MHKLKINSAKKNAALLLVLWGLVQFSILVIQGINANGEALRFIQEANLLNNHQPFSSPVYYMYLIEILLVLIKIKFSLTFHFIIAIQLSLNVTALFVFKKFVKTLYDSERISFIASSLLILCIPYQFFNSYIYTESIFFSLSIIFSCYLLSVKKITPIHMVKIACGLVLLCVTRPTGIFFVGATFIWCFIHVTRSISLSQKLMMIAAMGLLFFFIINNIMGSGEGVNIIKPFKEEHIICDVPTLIRQTDLHSTDDNSIYGLAHYIAQHPKQFLRLGLLKTMAFFGINRSYFSFQHNLFTNTFFYLLYTLIISGIVLYKKVKFDFFVYYSSILLFFWMLVVFSCDEWNNRFFLTLTPFLILMSLPFVDYLLKRKDR